jgi:hypothetical protein
VSHPISKMITPRTIIAVSFPVATDAGDAL